MSNFNRFSIYPCRFGSILLRDLSDFSWRTASNKSVVTPGGDLHPRAVVNCCSDPMATFSTRDFDSLFGGGGPSLTTGYAVDTNGGTSASLLQFQARTDGGAFASAGNHVVGTNNKGFLNVTEISASQDDTAGAKISCEYTLLSQDGSTVPMTYNAAATLTSTPLFDGIWFMGPVYYGIPGTSNGMNGVQSVTITPGIQFKAPRADGMVYPQIGSIYAINPEIRIRTLSSTSLASTLTNPWGSPFASSATSFLIYFQKGVHGGARVASATANHVLVNVVIGDVTTDSISVQQVDDATTEIILRPTQGTMTITNNVAIT